MPHLTVFVRALSAVVIHVVLGAVFIQKIYLACGFYRIEHIAAFDIHIQDPPGFCHVKRGFLRLHADSCGSLQPFGYSQLFLLTYGSDQRLQAFRSLHKIIIGKCIRKHPLQISALPKKNR